MRSNALQGSPLDTIAWYAWESDEPESNWLLTYVDMLSVLLAMLVVLLGHMAVQQMQHPLPDSQIAPVASVVETTQALHRIEEEAEVNIEPDASVVETTQALHHMEEAEVEIEPDASVVETTQALHRMEEEAEVEIEPDASVVEPTQALHHMEEELEVEIELGASVAEPTMTPSPEEAITDNIEPAAEPRLPSPESRLEAAIDADFQGAVKVVRRDHGISLEIADVILFESNKAALRSQAGDVLARLAITLQDIGDAEIAVEGHTDDRPIKGGRFLSNWDLAAARANAVTQFLLEQGFAPARLRSVSYADTHPVADNQTAEGRAENRRVSLRVDFLSASNNPSSRFLIPAYAGIQ